MLTALIAGSVAALAFGLPLTSGLLIGAVLAPTDPAILIPLFERLGLRPKVSQTIIAESALNDPTGAVLALAVAGVVISGSASLTQPLQDFVVNLVISTASASSSVWFSPRPCRAEGRASGGSRPRSR